MRVLLSQSQALQPYGCLTPARAQAYTHCIHSLRAHSAKRGMPVDLSQSQALLQYTCLECRQTQNLTPARAQAYTHCIHSQRAHSAKRYARGPLAVAGFAAIHLP